MYNRPFDGRHNVQVALSENEFDTSHFGEDDEIRITFTIPHTLLYFAFPYRHNPNIIYGNGQPLIFLSLQSCFVPYNIYLVQFLYTKSVMKRMTMNLDLT